MQWELTDHFSNAGFIRRSTAWTGHGRPRSSAIIYKPIKSIGRTRNRMKSLQPLRLRSRRAGTRTLNRASCVKEQRSIEISSKPQAMCLSTKQKGPSRMKHKGKRLNVRKIEMQALVVEKDFYGDSSAVDQNAATHPRHMKNSSLTKRCNESRRRVFPKAYG